MIIRPERVLKDSVDRAALNACIREHLAELPRLDMLRAYYDGRHGIDGRVRAPGLPNNRLTHAFPRYICTMASGYLIGNPVAYTAPDAQFAPLLRILEAYRQCSIDSVDAELARQASIYGKGVELIFADQSAQPRTAALDPRSAFVVYDDSVEARPLFGVRIVPMLRTDGEEQGKAVEVYTATHVIRYRAASQADVGEPVSAEPHFFGGVPMVEYWNGEDERGDFECVLSLIDAYDQLESDRINDKQQFVDALLLLYGCTLETDARGRSPGRQLREDKVLSLPDSDARAEWLCKQLNEADAEILKNALRSDIHKMSMVPDLTDEHFAGNSSGVAMRYKLLGLEQLTRIKERWFREALRQRLKLFGLFLEVRGAPRLDISGVHMAFTRSLPVNELEEAQTLNALKGLVPDDDLAERAERICGFVS